MWLVEVDLEQPSLAKIFNVDSGPGLCAVLEGTQGLEAVAYPVAKNFSLVPAGAANGNGDGYSVDSVPRICFIKRTVWRG